MNENKLPWSFLSFDEVKRMKIELRKEDSDVFDACFKRDIPKEIIKILRYIDGLYYLDIPNYDFIHLIIQKIYNVCFVFLIFFKLF